MALTVLKHVLEHHLDRGLGEITGRKCRGVERKKYMGESGFTKIERKLWDVCLIRTAIVLDTSTVLQ